MSSYSDSYKAAGVDVTAGYRAVELMKKHVARTVTSGVLDTIGGFGGMFELDLTGIEKPVLVSECGGYSWTVPGHSYAKYTNYGYGGCKDSQSLTGRIGALYRETILTAIPKGLSGCVYTQLSDVEDETNGCYTYDRRVCKVDRVAMRRLAKELEEKLAGREKP